MTMGNLGAIGTDSGLSTLKKREERPATQSYSPTTPSSIFTGNSSSQSSGGAGCSLIA